MKVASHISGQKILFNIYIIDEENDSIIRIDDTAADIWLMINNKKHITDIVRKICEDMLCAMCDQGTCNGKEVKDYPTILWWDILLYYKKYLR